MKEIKESRVKGQGSLTTNTIKARVTVGIQTSQASI